MALFFATLGTLIDPKVLSEHLPLLGFMLMVIVFGKFLVWASVVWLFRYPLRTAIAVAAGLTQIGELSFVAVQVARTSGLVDESVFSTVIAASLISILFLRRSHREEDLPHTLSLSRPSLRARAQEISNASEGQRNNGFGSQTVACVDKLELV